MNQRPTGVTILASLAAIGGVLGIIGGLAVALVGGVAGGLAGRADLGSLAFIGGGVEVVLGAIWLASAIGAWGGRAWAWATGIVIALANILLPIIGVVIGWRSITYAAVTVVIAGIILYYLNQPNVKRFFGR